MSVTIIRSTAPTTLEELIEAVEAFIMTAASEGYTSDTVYLNLANMTLERASLTDGSSVLNVAFQIAE